MVKKYTKEIICFYIFAVISLIVATFYDLKIDIALNNPNDFIGNWFWKAGELPNSMICPLAGLALFKSLETKRGKIIGAIIMVGGSIYLGAYVASYSFVDDSFKTPFGIIFGFLFGILLLFLSKYIVIPEEYKKALIVVAIVGIIAMAVQLGVINIAKIFWGRIRMRELIRIGSYESFVPWYKPQGITSSNEFKSFPSGHTASAGMSYLLMLAPFINKKLESKKALLFVAPFVYTSVVAYSRMVMGAHFLSDVTVGGVVAFTTVIVIMSVLDKKTKTFNSSN